MKIYGLKISPPYQEFIRNIRIVTVNTKTPSQLAWKLAKEVDCFIGIWEIKREKRRIYGK